MSSGVKRFFLCLIGILAGIAAWGIVEIIIIFQIYFPSYLVFSIVLGIAVGVFMSGFFGSSEGMFLAESSKIKSGIITGAIIGIIGGVIGFLMGQASLFIVGDKLIHSMSKFKTIGLPVSRSIGWVFLGIFVGVTEGVRARSLNKIKVGIIGGLLGGAIGGLLVEYIPLFFSENLYIARLAGFIIFGFFIGLFYGFVEKSMSYGVLKLLNGKYKGKEFLINQRRIKIGSSKKNDITLLDYENVEEFHALLHSKSLLVTIKNRAHNFPLKINDDVAQEQELRIDDVIQIGTAKFLFKYK